MKSNESYTLEGCELVGNEVGSMIAAFMWGMLQGIANYRAKENAIPEKEKEKGCSDCWCYDCPNFEECIVAIDGFDPDDEACPCDGCTKTRKAYMPRDEKPTCEYRTAGNKESE